jgi:hypothetical protein
MPQWLVILAWVSLAAHIVLALVIAADELRRPQPMWIMNIVWPVTALYGGLFALWAYYRFGRARADGQAHHAMHQPKWQQISKATMHCGAGCTLGDLGAEWVMWAAPWTLFGQKMFGAWVVDFLFAFVLGIAFQYFTIVPMQKLSPGQGLIAALKADALSLSAWQVGMYGWMAIARFALFRTRCRPRARCSGS